MYLYLLNFLAHNWNKGRTRSIFLLPPISVVSNETCSLHFIIYWPIRNPERQTLTRPELLCDSERRLFSLIPTASSSYLTLPSGVFGIPLGNLLSAPLCFSKRRNLLCCISWRQKGTVLLSNSFFLLQVRVTQGLKQTHTEQINRLHIKHQTECDLLEDLRWAVKGQAVVE